MLFVVCRLYFLIKIHHSFDSLIAYAHGTGLDQISIQLVYTVKTMELLTVWSLWIAADDQGLEENAPPCSVRMSGQTSDRDMAHGRQTRLSQTGIDSGPDKG